MSTRWERFAGDTSTFAVRLAFHRDPDDGAGASSEMALSWGALQIWVRGINLCSHVDQGETMQSSHWYLLPVLEWLAENWDPLLHEQRPPSGMRSIATATDVDGTASVLAYSTASPSQRTLQDHYEWEQRHSLRSARDGGILPDLRIRRLADQVEISWKPAELAGADGVEFLATEGASYEAPSAVAEPLHEVLSSAAEWLHLQLPSSSRFEALTNAVKSLRSTDHTDARTAWLAGLAATREHVISRWNSIKDAARELGSPEAFGEVFGGGVSSGLVLTGSCDAALLFGSASPTITEGDARTLASLLLSSYDPDAHDGLAHLVADEPLSPHVRPWQQGYELAEDLLHEIGSLEGPAVDIEGLLATWEVQVSSTDLADEQLRAVAFVSRSHSPSIVLNTGYRWGTSTRARRFTLAHELCHLLHDRTRGSRLAIASGPWAPKAIEQRANAFAAWLLMPPDLVRSAIAAADSAVDSPEGVEAIADLLEVSTAAFIEHAHNLGLIDAADREDLRVAFRD